MNKAKNMSRETSNRKIQHLYICAEKEVESKWSGFEDIYLIHNALPEVDKDVIEYSINFLEHEFKAPLLIASMTGGHKDTKKVNIALAKAAEELGIGIGVGSQRAALENSSLEDTYRVVRDYAPSAFIYGNLGAAQLRKYGIEGIERAIEMIDADAMAIHLNFLQEAIQLEGDVNAKGVLAEIKEICKASKVPIIVKETGAGISHKVAWELKKAGVAAIDVGGLGGTSFAGVEYYRAVAEKNAVRESLGKLFWNWGIPTAVSIVESKVSEDMHVIATGGIRSGLDAAKAIALGASLCGIALPLLKPALKSEVAVIEKLKLIMEELKVAMFLSGCACIEDLKKAQLVITGKTREFLEQRGFNIKHYSTR
ncbi:MAG: type 2 isopentenyl-diphosphate Delta-isomerase [Methanocellales archaeon]